MSDENTILIAPNNCEVVIPSQLFEQINKIVRFEKYLNDKTLNITPYHFLFVVCSWISERYFKVKEDLFDLVRIYATIFNLEIVSEDIDIEEELNTVKNTLENSLKIKTKDSDNLPSDLEKLVMICANRKSYCDFVIDFFLNNLEINKHNLLYGIINLVVHKVLKFHGINIKNSRILEYGLSAIIDIQVKGDIHVYSLGENGMDILHELIRVNDHISNKKKSEKLLKECKYEYYKNHNGYLPKTFGSLENYYLDMCRLYNVEPVDKNGYNY